MMHNSFDKLSVTEVTYQCPMLLPKACWLLNDFTFFFFFFYRAYFRKVVYQSGKCCEHDVIIMVPYASRLLTNHPCFPHLVDYKSMIKNLILLMLTLALYQYTSMFYTGKKKGRKICTKPSKNL